MQGKLYKPTPPPQLSDSNRRIIDSNSSSKRVYQVWKGSNRFFLGGRLIFGPDVRSLLFTVFLIVTPVILFGAFVSQKLVTEFPYHLGNLIVAISAIFTIYIIMLLFLTSGRDPGIIPRNLHPPELEDDGDASSLSTDWAGNQSGAPSLPPTKDVLVNGTVVKVKYCHTCMLYRPPRCSHCSICNNCVERFDHHCPWVGQCIGKRNYRFFFMFVSSTTMLCLYVFAFCWVNIRKIMEIHHCNLWKALLKSPVSGILILYTFIAVWFVGGLTTFHLYLICTNQTTYENFRYRYDGKRNPYNLGWVRNVREIFFSKIPISRNNFRAKVQEDSSSAFNTSLSMGRVMSPEMPKRSFDIEMGGKRQAVAAEEFEDIQNQIESVAALERCGTQPRHTNWVQKGNWEITPDLHALAAEFGIEHGLTDRVKIGGH
ncbi:probable protein S-acyltransferase 7 [Telopea speciosissima]|uniref:probable protein S-acyltransferase 7 n=1 Tax=Telopea speciosissima TaxID=54955 RepID=UPI001CC632BA|nr:probable protein S-acyltransferase 7 [Telopea speciosissima]XP_043703414.1 probable protein S-acyltransferase 7 [Telopea speciosissima]